MTNPNDLIDALVAKLRAISALVIAVGQAGYILAYKDNYPNNVNLVEALVELRTPGIMIVWRGSGPANSARREVWQHQFSIFIKAVGEAADFWDLIVDGVPAGGDGLKMLRTEIHPNVGQMNTPSIARRSLPISQFATLDYFEATLSLNEKGDY